MNQSIDALSVRIANADRAWHCAEATLRIAALSLAARAIDSVQAYADSAADCVIAAHELDPSRICEAAS